MRHHVIHLIMFIAAFLWIPYPIVAGNTISFAFIGIKTTGIDDAYGTVSENIISADVHAEESFRLMDKTQMARIARGKGILDFDITDIKRIADSGKLLKVDKLIVGTIIKQTNYRIDIRTVDSATESTEFIYTDQVKSESDIIKSVKKAAEKIRRYYTGQGNVSGTMDIDINAVTQIPVGAYAKYLFPSYGASLSVIKNNVLNDNLGFLVSGDINVFSPKTDRYKSFTQYGASGGVNGRFSPFQTIIIIPNIRAGAVWSRLVYDKDGIDVPAMKYEPRTFCNFFIHGGAQLSLSLYQRWMLSVNIGYTNVFDTSKSGRLFTLGIGIKTLL